MFWLVSMLGLAALSSIILVGDEAADNDGNRDLDGAEPGTGLEDLLAEDGDADTEAVPEVQGGDGPDVMVGTRRADVMSGGSGADEINGYDGADWLGGGEGADTLYGAAGDDTLAGGAGADLLHGGDGIDLLRGGEAGDRLYGHFGGDLLSGGAGADLLHGGQGADVLEGGAGADSLHGNDGDDTLRGGAGEDALFGGYGDDLVSGAGDAGARDYVNGGGGADTLLAGEGDVLTGGAGADLFVGGAWTGSEEAVQLIDYDAAEDQLVLVWDAEDSDPEVEVQDDPEAPDNRLILVNGAVALRISGEPSLSAADVAVMDSESAAQSGLLPAAS
ncbi:calcium-binding protein [Cribrihabitans neustonicus]|uniref:calcium-binding protein n=1 Tax=Cribrihabitans neustonicus TaxID=1429085 RepID=UPI003B5AAC01